MNKSFCINVTNLHARSYTWTLVQWRGGRFFPKATSTLFRQMTMLKVVHLLLRDAVLLMRHCLTVAVRAAETVSLQQDNVHWLPLVAMVTRSIRAPFMWALCRLCPHAYEPAKIEPVQVRHRGIGSVKSDFDWEFDEAPTWRTNWWMSYIVSIGKVPAWHAWPC